MNESRRVLVLGAGIGGTAAADTLRRLLPASHEVVLIERAQEHVFSPSLLWFAVGRRSRQQITRPMGRTSRRGIRLVAGTIEKIDARSRVVVVDGQAMEGDAVVVALGADYDLMATPGLQAGGHDLYSLEGAEALRTTLSRFDTGTFSIVTAAPAYKCPAAPYEAAMLVERCLRERGIRGRVQMEFWAAEPGPMGVAGPVVSAAVKAMVESRGIAYRPGRQIREVDAIAGHKLYAPKGIGALFVKKGLEARESLYNGLHDRVPTIRLNGHPDRRLPNTLSVGFPGVDADRILESIGDRIAASAGATCHSGSVAISGVLQAMHVPIQWARGTLRFSTGRNTTEDEIREAVDVLASAYKGLA